MNLPPMVMALILPLSQLIKMRGVRVIWILKVKFG